MKGRLFAFLFVVALVACADKDKIPGDILPPEKMREVLWDMTRAGEFLYSFVLEKDSGVDKVAESHKWYNKIYEIHKITAAQFEKSFAYYKDHPALMKPIFDSLTKKQVSTRAAPSLTDSVRNAEQGKRDTLVKIDSVRRRSLVDSIRKKRILRRKNIKPV